MTPSIRSASRGSARSALSASRRQLRTRFTTRLESACATYRLRSISYDCSRQEGPMVRDHQSGEAVFRSILPEDIDWKPFPAFPPSARLAVLVGEPTQAGPYVIRVKVPSGVKLMPHRHPEDRIYTVMSGVFYIGLGDRFDGDKVRAFPPGSVIVLPSNTSHFHWAKSGEYITQVMAIGPLGLEYLDPTDDPRERTRQS